MQRLKMLACAALVGAGLVTGTASAEELSTISWSPCPEDATAECAKVRLPIDWANPGGSSFDLAITRRKATDPGKRIGVLLVNPGGPGGSGVSFVHQVRNYFSPEVQARFDLIGFDPRGVARSQPVLCSADVMARQPSVYPRNQAEFDKLVAFNRELKADCERTSGPMFQHADTKAVVHDVEALRKALGETKINFYGVFYGTLIGQQYAELYGDRIRAMVLEANVDHSIDGRQFATLAAMTTEDAFNQFISWCDRTTSCKLHNQNVAAVWDDLLARADRGEMGTLTSQQIIERSFGALYGPMWNDLANYIASLQSEAPLATKAVTVENPFQAVFCEDWDIRPPNFTELNRLMEIERRVSPRMRGSQIGHTAITTCLGWPSGVNNPQHKLSVTKAPKILLLQGLHDPAASHTWGLNVQAQMAKTSSLLTYEGAGFGVYTRSTCTRGKTDGYLINLIVPAHGTRCAAVE